MKFETYNSWSQLPQNIDSLFKYCSQSSMFLTREWFETLYDTEFTGNKSLLLLCVLDKGQVLALLPLIGSDENKESFSHRYTALYSLLLSKENQSTIIDCLAEGLSKMPVYSLALSPIAEDDQNILRLKVALESLGYEHHQKFFFYNWIHRTHQQSFDDYMAERPAQLRNTIVRKQRKLEREHKYNIRLFKDDDVQQGLIDYHAIYSSSWKASEQHTALLNSAAINLSVPNWTRLAVLTIDGKAAAAQLWFVVQGKASIFRLAYDEEWRKYSPGSILTAYLMQYVIDIDKAEEIDFLTGNESYKQDWMSERRQRFRVMFVKHRKPLSKLNMVTRLIKNMFKRKH